MIVQFYGIMGSGKTTAMHDWVRAHVPHGHRFFVKTRTRDWEPGHPMWRGQEPRIIEVPAHIRDHDRFEELVEEPGVYLFGHGWEPAHVAQLCIDVGDVTLVDDELDFSCDRWKRNPLREIVHQGRHLFNRHRQECEVHILGACRKVQSLPSDFGMAAQIFVFRMQGDLALQRLRVDGIISEEEFEAISNLPTFHYKHWPSNTWGHVEPL